MDLRFREQLTGLDPSRIERLVRDTGFFSLEEISVARELADDGLSEGVSSHYHFLLAEIGEILAGFACFGRIPCTESAWDVYWIAVSPETQGKHLGRQLLQWVEKNIQIAGGTQVYADTSSRPQYGPTRGFYTRQGYQQAAEFPDFYAPGDGKIIFGKILGGNPT